MAQIVVCEFMDPMAVKAASVDYEIHYDPDLVDDPKQLHALLTDTRALVVRNRTQVDRKLLDAAPQLVVVGRLGVGLDNIDMQACRERGVKVCPAAGTNDASVAEWVITSAMVLLRQAFFHQPAILSGRWPRNQCIGREIAGKTLGLVGFGAIAQVTSRMALALGMTVVAYDPYLPDEHAAWRDVTRMDSLTALLSAADAVSLHVPLTDETRHLIDAPALAAMKPDAILLNAARGGVVDEAALVQALKAGKLGGAALDVFETEPLTAAAAERFIDVPNVLLTPHIGASPSNPTSGSAI